MRVNSILQYPISTSNKHLLKNDRIVSAPIYPNDSVNFKGKFGQIVGGTIGTGAIMVGSFFLAPALVCLSGIGLLLGAAGGDIAEDAVNKKENKDDRADQ